MAELRGYGVLKNSGAKGGRGELLGSDEVNGKVVERYRLVDGRLVWRVEGRRNRACPYCRNEVERSAMHTCAACKLKQKHLQPGEVMLGWRERKKAEERAAARASGKECTECGRPFVVRRGGQLVCSTRCGVARSGRFKREGKAAAQAVVDLGVVRALLEFGRARGRNKVGRRLKDCYCAYCGRVIPWLATEFAPGGAAAHFGRRTCGVSCRAGLTARVRDGESAFDAEAYEEWLKRNGRSKPARGVGEVG